MPIYGYRCQSCEQDFEVTQRMTDAPQAACPVCNGAGTRQFFPIGIHFKGSGFYKTDSRAAAATTVPASAGDSQKTGEKTTSTTTDDSGSKPAKDAAGTSPPAPTTPSKTTPPKAASTAD